MSLTRRDLLTGGGLAMAMLMLGGCGAVRPATRALGLGAPPLPAWAGQDGDLWRRLSRLTFGPRPDELARANEHGYLAWVEEQLAPEQIDDRMAEWRVRRFDLLRLDASLLFDARPEQVRRELQQATLLRAVYSRRQLYELMVDFWSDHFSLSTLKGDGAWLKAIDDRSVIRPHAFGRFGDLLWAAMRSPALLHSLDNQANQRGRPNENYARELLELHSLGVDAGYTQRDVEELARCLTGWGSDERRQRGRFAFVPERHDDEAKLVLGHWLPAGGGERDVERVHQLIMAHSALPRFISHKLVRRLVADEPPASLVEQAAATFRQTGGDIRAVLRTILLADELVSAPPRFKRPFQLVAGALRQLQAESDGGPALLDSLAAMGQPLFEWPTPDGFPESSQAWHAGLLARWQWAIRLATNALPGTTIDLPALARTAALTAPEHAIDHLARLLLGQPLPPPETTLLQRLLGQQLDEAALAGLAAILLASPRYQWRG